MEQDNKLLTSKTIMKDTTKWKDAQGQMKL
jgi:hypothetical protein